MQLLEKKTGQKKIMSLTDKKTPCLRILCFVWLLYSLCGLRRLIKKFRQNLLQQFRE